MARLPPDNDAKVTDRRRRRAADTARWRSRRRRNVQVFQIEIDAQTYDIMLALGRLRQEQISNKFVVATALGKLLRNALDALLRENNTRRR